ncbi:hypothetical protein ACRRTK_012180 [Alexandromys fortis]
MLPASPGPPTAPAKGVEMPLNVYFLPEDALQDLRIIACKWLFLGTLSGWWGCTKACGHLVQAQLL